MNFISAILGKREPEKGGLVLSREVGEHIFIGDDITVTVLGWKQGGRIDEIELHIEAPKGIVISRGELGHG